ncbi:MAG: hypothetical protein K2X35_19800 [Bryobacteraceae bacterium]|nr:hypothetical protein [Bryobacteraceae bacterium]
MKKLLICSAAFALTGAAVAQTIATRPRAQALELAPPDILIERGTAASAGIMFEVIAGGMGGRAMKGAPYSAEAVTETVQTLADGNRIVRKHTSLIYRDSEGRERREQSLRSIGPWQTGEAGHRSITINDPVAKLSYTLDPDKKVAHKVPSRLFSYPAERVAEWKAAEPGKSGEQRKQAEREAVTATLGQRVEVHTFERGVAAGGIGGSMVVFNDSVHGVSNNVKSENLGARNIEGVMAEGTRTTITLPAGSIGNERDIQTVTERWFSKELGLLVMSKTSDPRSGETTYRLTNISRQEPLRSLFEIPSDYTVDELKSKVPDAQLMDKLMQERKAVIKQREMI